MLFLCNWDSTNHTLVFHTFVDFEDVLLCFQLAAASFKLISHVGSETYDGILEFFRVYQSKSYVMYFHIVFIDIS